MIKLFLLLIAGHGVLCAPEGFPFTEYGLPGSSNLGEKSLPWTKLQEQQYQPGGSNLDKNLPGTRNLMEKSQLPEVLPGTRNLDEKSIPDTITLRKIPIPYNGLELPRLEYDEAFNPTIASYKLSETPDSEKIQTPDESSDQQDVVTPYYYYPPISHEDVGSEIKEIEIAPISQTPLHPVPTPAAPGPEEFSGGGEVLGTSILPGSVAVLTSGDLGPLEIPPDSKIKVQDIHGQYSHGFANPDGTQVEESGHLISTDDGWEYVIAKEGSYRYYSPEGIPISVRYIADENGFRIISQTFAGR